MATDSYGSWVGPGSQFRVRQWYSGETDNGSGYTVTCNRIIYVYVPSGGGGFRGTNVSTNYIGTVTLYTSDAGSTSFNRSPSYGSSVGDGYIWAQYTGGSGTTYRSATGGITYTAPNYVCKITYNANGGSGAPAAQTYNYASSGTTTLSSTRPSRKGYDFKGWSLSSTATSASYSAGQGWNLNNKGNYTLYAVWSPKKITLTLAKNGGSGGTSKVYYKYGTNKFYSDSACATQITSITLPTKTGHTFVQYNGDGTVGGTSGERYIYNDGTFASDLCTDIYNNATLTAQWSVNSYTLTINPGGGSWGGTTSNSTATQNYNTTKSIAVPTRTGYTFGGWFKTAYGSLNNSSVNNPIFTSSTPLPVVYNNAVDGTVTHTRQSDTSAGYTYTLKIVCSSSSATPGMGGFTHNVYSEASQTFIHFFRAKVPSGYTINYHNNAVGTGSTFTWLTDNKGTGAWKDYAYKLVCGSSGTFNTFSYVALAEGTAPVTWYLGGSQVTKAPTSAQTFTYGASNTTLYAKWIPNRYTISYDANGGSGAPSAQTATHGENLTLSSTKPTRLGYTFLGWSTNSSATSASYSAGSAYSFTANTKLYAVWQVIDKVNLTFSSSSYTISNTTAGKANLSTLDIPFTLSNVTSTNTSKSYWYTPWYYSKGGAKVSLSQRGPGTITSSGSGILTLSIDEIKNYLIDTDSIDKINMSVDVWTDSNNVDITKASTNFSATIDNYGKPQCEILTAHRNTDESVAVSTQVVYSPGYTNLSAARPTLSWGATELPVTPTVEKISENVYKYEYIIPAASAPGVNNVSLYFSDDIFSSTAKKRVAATHTDQLFKIVKTTGICYAFELIEK